MSKAVSWVGLSIWLWHLPQEVFVVDPKHAGEIIYRAGPGVLWGRWGEGCLGYVTAKQFWMSVRNWKDGGKGCSVYDLSEKMKTAKHSCLQMSSFICQSLKPKLTDWQRWKEIKENNLLGDCFPNNDKKKYYYKNKYNNLQGKSFWLIEAMWWGLETINILWSS